MGVIPAFSQRLASLYRRESAELAELALLPGLGEGSVRQHVFRRVLIGRPPLQVALLGTPLLAMTAYWKLAAVPAVLAFMLMTALLLAFEASHALGRAQPYFGNAMLALLIDLAALLIFAIGGLILFRTRLSGQLLHQLNWLIPVILAAALTTFLCARNWLAQAARLVQPFMNASDRQHA
ncbi:MAG: hypothetical protein QM718_00155 [Steroidobacteraceae bacterium]